MTGRAGPCRGSSPYGVAAGAGGGRPSPGAPARYDAVGRDGHHERVGGKERQRAGAKGEPGAHPGVPRRPAVNRAARRPVPVMGTARHLTEEER